MSLTTSFLLIISFVVIYAFLIEIFSVLFRITGLTKEKSKFQAISLLTSCGFTTSESEIIMTNKARRKIATASMITGYAFSVIIVSLLINVFFNLNTQQLRDSAWFIVISLSCMIFVIIFIKIPVIRNAIDKVIETIALTLFKKSNKENVLTLLDNYGKDAIVEIYLNKIPDILANKSLIESKIKDNYKINFLMYNRKGKIHDVHRNTIFQKGDVLVVFGSYQNIKDLFSIKIDDVETILDNSQSNYQNDIDLMENYGSDAMAEIKVNTVPEFLIDNTLVTSKIKELYKINVMMIKRNDMPIKVTRDTKIQQYDSIIVFGPYQNIKEAFIITKIPSKKVEEESK